MKLLSLGTAYVDINAVNFPFTQGLLPEKEIKGGDYIAEPGGSALNFARICAALEIEPIFIGKTGNDHLSQLLDTLCKENNITPAFIKSNTVQTNIGINFVNDQGLSLMAGVGTANQSLSFEEAEAQIDRYIDAVDYLYLGGGFKMQMLIPHFSELIKKAHEHNTLVLLDHSRVHNKVTAEEKRIMREVVPQVDIYFPSHDELLDLWEAESVNDAITKIQANSQVKIILKDGKKGSYAFINGKETHVESFSVTPRNTIGAGDSFNAGFIKGLSQSLPIEECLKLGNAIAALKISQSTVPTLSEIQAFMKERFH